MNAAIKAGTIPNIPIPTMGKYATPFSIVKRFLVLTHRAESNLSPGADGNPAYPKGSDATGSEICSATFECRGTGDIWDAPDGTVALAFDDGPLAPSPTLYEFLKSKNTHATHFFIGGNICALTISLLEAFERADDVV